MTKKTILFAPAAFSLAETTRMLEVARGIVEDEQARELFDVCFASEGGKFESLIEERGFTLHRVSPRMSDEKIAHLMAINDEEKFGAVYSKAEMIEKVEGDLRLLDQVNPTLVVTGSYLSMPVSCRLRSIPLVWTIQSTWLPEFFASGAGTTDNISWGPLRSCVNLLVFWMIRFWMWFGFIRSVNQAAAHFGLRPYRPVFEFFKGDLTLVAEPPGFSTVALPPQHEFVGPLIPHQTFSLPPELTNIPRDLPLVFFAMGSSGVPHIVKDLLESFRDKPLRVIAPVRALLQGLDVDIPPNVVVTDWLPALEVNRMVDVALIHGGIGTVLTAALAGKPVVGVGMQPEQVANLACLERRGMAIRVKKSKNARRLVSDVHSALTRILNDDAAKREAADYARSIVDWQDAPARSARLIVERYGREHS